MWLEEGRGKGEVRGQEGKGKMKGLAGKGEVGEKEGKSIGKKRVRES